MIRDRDLLTDDPTLSAETRAAGQPRSSSRAKFIATMKRRRDAILAVLATQPVITRAEAAKAIGGTETDADSTLSRMQRTLNKTAAGWELRK